MFEKNYKLPSIVWLRMTDYTHGWLQYELGCSVRVGGQRVLCVQHLPGARDILRMDTFEDMLERRKIGHAMSATRKNCIEAGMELDASLIEREYGVSRQQLQLFVPIECPKMCINRDGVLRPWTLDVCFGKEQVTAMQRLLRNAFWSAVEDFDAAFASRLSGKKYPAVDMVEDFCAETKTPDLYVEAIRREWQRRMKRRR